MNMAKKNYVSSVWLHARKN